jgi:hypothetical protein
MLNFASISEESTLAERESRLSLRKRSISSRSRAKILTARMPVTASWMTEAIAPSFVRTTRILSMRACRYLRTARKRKGTVTRASAVKLGLIQSITISIPIRIRKLDPTSTTESTRRLRTSLTSLVTRVMVSPVRRAPW